MCVDLGVMVFWLRRGFGVKPVKERVLWHHSRQKAIVDNL